MSNPNINLSNLDARYSKPTDVSAAISAQATTDAGQYAPVATPAAIKSSYTPLKPYNATGQLYNLSASSLRRYRAALARSKTGGAAARIACYGHSQTYGLFQPDPLQANSYPGRLKTLLNASNVIGPVRDGYIWFNNNQIVTNGASICDTRITLGGGWGMTTGAGPGGGTVMLTSATSGTTDITPDYTWDTCDILYFQRTGGGYFGATIDSGTESGQATAGTAALDTKTVSAGSVGTHTLHLRGAGSGQPWLASVRFYTAATVGGVELSRCGIPGAKTSDWVLDTDATKSLVAAFDVAKPDLTFFNILTNDYVLGVNPITTQANLATIIQRAQANGGDVCLVVDIPSGSTANGYTLNQYQQVAYKIADQYDCALVDLGDRWSSYVFSNQSPYLMYADNNHPSTKGYQDVAQAIYNVILHAA